MGACNELASKIVEIILDMSDLQENMTYAEMCRYLERGQRDLKCALYWQIFLDVDQRFLDWFIQLDAGDKLRLAQKMINRTEVPF